MEQEWILENDNDSHINVDIDFATNVPVEKLFFNLAAKGILSSKIRAYKLGPIDLGNLSITSNRTNPADIHSVFWVNHNVVVKLFSAAKDVNLISMAYTLDKYLNQHVTKNPYDKAPEIHNIEITPDKILVNEPFWIKFHPETKQDAKYLMGPELEDTQDGTFDIQGQDTLAIKLKITNPGDFVIPMWVGDKRTLLSSRVVARIKVLPNDDETNTIAPI